MFLVPLNKKQKELIRKVAAMQLASFKDILDNEGNEEIYEYCRRHYLDEDEYKYIAKMNLKVWRKLYLRPSRVGTLDEDNKSILLTLMFRYYDRPKYNGARVRIHEKLQQLSYYPINPN